MKKILIFYGSYGAGHFSAARSIKEYIDSNYKDCETKIVDCIEYINKFFNKISVKTYDHLSMKVPWAWKRVYYDSEKWPIKNISKGANQLFSIKLYKLISNYNPDIIISTHFFPSQMCCVLKKKGKINCKLATVLTDYAPHGQWLIYHEYVDYFFVAHKGMISYLTQNGVEENKIFATGIPLSNKFLQNYNKENILKEFNLKPGKTTVLFFAGGSSHLARGTSSDIFKSFISLFPNIQMLTITGKSEKLKKEFDELVMYNHKEDSIKVLNFTNQVPQLMSVSDLVITKPGGLTTTESLASGLPIIIIDPIPGQEEENAQFLEKNGVAIWLKKEDNIEKVLSDLFASPDKIKEMKIKARLLAKKNSTKDICNILLS